MRLQIPEQVNRNCYVFKLGFTFPICIYSYHNFYKALDRMEKRVPLGLPLREYHYSRYSYGGVPRIKNISNIDGITNRRWYAGHRRWHDSGKQDYWLVFKSERDRTLAMMFLQE